MIRLRILPALLVPAVLSALFTPPPAAAADIAVRASLEPALIGIDETATLTIEARGRLSGVSFRPDFDLENLEIVGGPYQYEDIRIGNGSLARSYRVSWRLRPLGTGRARVHSLRLQFEGQVVQMRDREITVQEDPTGEVGPDDREDWTMGDPFGRSQGSMRIPFFGRPRRPAVFLRAEVQPARPFVGQQVLYTVYLYTRDDITSIATREMPTFRGFWVRDIPQPQKIPTDMVELEGERYGRVPLMRKALFPLRSGQHTIEATEMDLVVRMFDQRLFGPPLSRSEPVHLRTPAMTVFVQPLPPAPAGFGGAVGQLSLAARIQPAHLRIGEAATLTLTLAGRGNVQGVAEPEIKAPEGMTVYPPQQQSEEEVAGTAVRGSRTWSYVVVPERAGRHTLRVPSIPYFDPQAAKYRSAAVPPVQLTVLPRPEPEEAPPAARGAEPGEAREDPGLSWKPILPWAIALPLGIALGVALARRRNASRMGPVSSRLASDLEARLREAAAETRPRQMAARIEEGWSAFLAERWGVPAGTPPSRWSAALKERGADPAAAEELAGLLDDLHYLRYAPQLCAAETMGREALDRCRRLLRRLR